MQFSFFYVGTFRCFFPYSNCVHQNFATHWLLFLSPVAELRFESLMVKILWFFPKKHICDVIYYCWTGISLSSICRYFLVLNREVCSESCTVISVLLNHSWAAELKNRHSISIEFGVHWASLKEPGVSNWSDENLKTFVLSHNFLHSF